MQKPEIRAHQQNPTTQTKTKNEEPGTRNLTPASLPPCTSGDTDPAQLSKPVPHPARFTEELLGFALYPWQREVLGWYARPRQRVLGALATPNGAGKTSCIVGGLAFWWLIAHPAGRVVITTERRLRCWWLAACRS